MQAEMVEAEALRRSDELKTALLRSISHDLRTPLTSIIAGGAALGSRDARPREERAELSEAVVAEGERLSRLVENLLDMSRLEAGKAEPHREPIDLAEVLDAAREAIGAARGWCGSRSTASCRWSTPTPPSSSAPSPTCSRTRSATAAAGRCWSSRRLVGDKIAVRVVDQGPGIPESEWQRIFEPFQHGEGGSGGGAGLGLAIAKGFVEANGGEIAVDSVAGQGSSFVVSMPCREGGVSERPAGPRLRRRAADPAGAEGDPPRRRLRGGPGRKRRGGARPGLGEAAGGGDRRPDAARHRRHRGDRSGCASGARCRSSSSRRSARRRRRCGRWRRAPTTT